MSSIFRLLQTVKVEVCNVYYVEYQGIKHDIYLHFNLWSVQTAMNVDLDIKILARVWIGTTQNQSLKYAMLPFAALCISLYLMTDDEFK